MVTTVTTLQTDVGHRAHAWATAGIGTRPDVAAAVVAASVATLLINWVRPDDSTGTYAMLFDLAVSLWVTFWAVTYTLIREIGRAHV